MIEELETTINIFETWLSRNPEVLEKVFWLKEDMKRSMEFDLDFGTKEWHSHQLMIVKKVHSEELLNDIQHSSFLVLKALTTAETRLLQKENFKPSIYKYASW